MTRGGSRRGAGRPTKAAATVEAGVYYSRPTRKLRPEDEDDGVFYTKNVLQTFISDLRKQGGAGKATVKVAAGNQWTKSTVNYETTHALYNEWPLVRSAVDWAIDTALENGYRTESDNEEAKKLLDELGKVLKIDNVILPRWILAIHKDGNIFDEVRWGSVKIGQTGQSYSAPVQLFPIPASEMGYQWKNDKGQEVEWAQDVGAGQWKTLKSETLITEPWRPDGYDPFGTPVINSILDDVQELLTFQSDYREIIRWYAKPLWHVMVGTENKPASDTLLRSIKSSWETREPNTDLITANNLKIEDKGIKNIPDVEPYLNFHDNKIIDGLESPFNHILRSANQASAAEIRDNSFSRVVFLQRWLKRLMESLFSQVLLKNNIEAKVKIVFKPLRTITLKEKMEVFLKLLNPQLVLLSDESRLEVENQLRMELLDVPRDDTLKQIKEPMPGQQGLVGKVKGFLTGNKQEASNVDKKAEAGVGKTVQKPDQQTTA